MLLAKLDPSRIKQALSSLVIKASKYGDKSKPVTVRLACTPGETTIEVENYGEQISMTTRAKMFELAQRGDNSDAELARSSLGLGRFIVRDLTRAPGGSATSEHREGRNVFSIPIPTSL